MFFPTTPLLHTTCPLSHPSHGPFLQMSYFFPSPVSISLVPLRRTMFSTMPSLVRIALRLCCSDLA